MRSLVKLTILITIVYFSQSCDEGEVCQEDIESYAYAGFHKIINGVLRDTTFEEIILIGMQNLDSISPDAVLNQKYVLLRLPHGSDSCKFIFSFAVYDSILLQYIDTSIIDTTIIDTTIIDISEDIPVITIDTIRIDTVIFDTTYEKIWDLSHYVADTLKLDFTRQLYLVSPNCGFSNLYDLTGIDYTNNLIHSVEIGIPEIGGFNEENIKILF